MELNKLYNIDCMIGMKEFPDNFFDLAIVDPPYGINVSKLAYTQEDNRPVKQKNGTILRVKKLKYEHKDWDKKSPTQEYFDEIFRISKHQIIWGINYFNLTNITNGRIKWNKCVPSGVSFSNYEYAYCSLLDQEIEFTYKWAGMMQGKSLSDPEIQQGNKKLNEKRIHPTQKPVKLYLWLLMNFADPNMKIIDTHVGSGSSIIAFEDFSCQYIGFEIDKDYYEAAIKRIEQHKSQYKLDLKQ